MVWDCATGNGQAAVELAAFFDQVIATDLSKQQIDKAVSHPKIKYAICPAEQSILPDACADLVTVAQSFHWFDQGKFFQESLRVLKPNGILAFWTYALAEISPKVDEVLFRFYNDELGPYWEPERSQVEQGYRNAMIPSTFQELPFPPFEMNAKWTFDLLIGYLGTWSALQTFIKKNGHNPIEKWREKINEAWGNESEHSIRWPLAVRIARVEKKL